MSEREVRYRWHSGYGLWIVQCNGKTEAIRATERAARLLAEEYKNGAELPSGPSSENEEWNYV